MPSVMLLGCVAVDRHLLQVNIEQCNALVGMLTKCSAILEVLQTVNGLDSALVDNECQVWCCIF